MSVQALYGIAIALYWKISERQNSSHSAFLKHQNTKYQIPFEILGLSEENNNLQSLWITLYFRICGQTIACFPDVSMTMESVKMRPTALGCPLEIINVN